MTNKEPPWAPTPSPETRARIREGAERRLSPEEIEAYLSTTVSDDERERMAELITWFRRRYPTAKERLAWCRRAYARWTRDQ
jgi:hypothetical protein